MPLVEERKLAPMGDWNKAKSISPIGDLMRAVPDVRLVSQMSEMICSPKYYQPMHIRCHVLAPSKFVIAHFRLSNAFSRCKSRGRNDHHRSCFWVEVITIRIINRNKRHMRARAPANRRLPILEPGLAAASGPPWTSRRKDRGSE